MTTTNSIITEEQVNFTKSIVGSLAADIDVAGLNNIIENIAAHNSNLKSEEKEMANKYINKWNTEVIARLKDKEDKLNSIIETIYRNYFHKYDECIVDKLEKLCLYSEDEEIINLFNTMKDKNDKLNNLIKEEAPILEVDDNPTFSKYQKQRIRVNNETKKDAFDNKVGELKADIVFTARIIVAGLRKNDKIKELVKNLILQLKDIRDMKVVMETKAEIAKVNITIENSEIRNLLRDMYEFIAKSL